MSATKAQINWASVQWGSNTITRVTAAMFGFGGKLIKFKGDTDLYPSIIACVDIEPHASITTADIGNVMVNFVPGTSNTLVATLKDAKAQSGGDCIFTMSNAVFENADGSGQHAQFGTISPTWQAYAADGQTPPLVITRA